MGHSIYPSRSRSQELRWCSVLALLVWFSGIAAQTITVTANDPSITYTGDWDDDGDHKSTTDTHASLIFTFTGTGFSWISRHNSDGGIVEISLDGASVGTVDESAGTSPGDTPQEAILFSQSGLDASQSHIFQMVYENIGQLGGHIIEVYGFEFVRNGVAPTSLTSEAPTTTSQFATSTVFSTDVPSSTLLPPSMTLSSASSTALTSSIPTLPTSPSSTSLLSTSKTSTSHPPKSSSPTSLSQSSSLPFSSLPTSYSPSAAGTPSSTGLPLASSTSHHSKNTRAALIGGIVGGVLGVVLLFLLALCLFRRRATRRRQRIVGPEHKARSYTSHTDTEDGYPHDYTSPGGSMSPISRKETMTSLSGETVNNESYRPMQQTGTAIAPAFAKRASERTESDSASAVRGDGQPRSTTNEGNEAARRASISSDSDSHGHSPSNSQGSARYVFHRLPRVPPPKI